MHIIDIISTILGVTLQCATLVSVIYALVRFTKKPTDNLQTQVTELQQWRKDVELRLRDGNDHFQQNDDSNRFTQSALIAILDAMGQMDTVPPDARQELKSRKKDLMNFLTDR